MQQQCVTSSYQLIAQIFYMNCLNTIVVLGLDVEATEHFKSSTSAYKVLNWNFLYNFYVLGTLSNNHSQLKKPVG